MFGFDSIVIQLPEPIATFLRDTYTEERETYLWHYSGAPWCFLSAHDPDGEPLSHEENAERTRQTVEYVRRLGCKAVTRQSWGCPAWLPEGGLLVLGISDLHAQQLALALRQNAIVVGGPNSCRLLYTVPDLDFG